MIDPLETAVAEWFLRERGIEADTLSEFGIGARSDGGVTFPYAAGEKIRYGIPTGERRFLYPKGASLGLFAPEKAQGKRVVFLCEGETDTMRLWQEAATLDDVGVVGLPGVNAWKNDFAPVFQDAEVVWVVLDNDQDYNVQASVERCWREIRRVLRGKAKRIKLPNSPHPIKDLCEFFRTYSLDDLRVLSNAPSQSWNYSALDLSNAYIPQPVDWLVEGLIGRGDLTLLFGEPGVGKSWLTMSLMLGIAQGADEWLGLPLKHAGRVLYVDEENHEDVIRSRLSKLGIRSEDAPAIRYLYEQGVRMDKNPDALIDEALSFEPELIVLDSLTRIHTEDEQSAGSIAKLFNDGLKPLARETGATVMIVHHAVKSREGTGYQRARGSGDITAAVDTSLEAFPLDAMDEFKLIPHKLRRGRLLPPIRVEIRDSPDDQVRLVTHRAMDKTSVPF